MHRKWIRSKADYCAWWLQYMVCEKPRELGLVRPRCGAEGLGGWGRAKERESKCCPSLSRGLLYRRQQQVPLRGAQRKYETKMTKCTRRNCSWIYRETFSQCSCLSAGTVALGDWEASHHQKFLEPNWKRCSATSLSFKWDLLWAESWTKWLAELLYNLGYALRKRFFTLICLFAPETKCVLCHLL